MDVPRHWRVKTQRYALIGEECPGCHSKIFPPRDVCPDCGSPAHAPFVFSGRGEVFSFSTVYQAPSTHEEQAPYTVALIRLEEGPLVTAQLADVNRDTIEIGMPVEMITRVLQSDGERGLIVYGYKFRPLTTRVH
jgi:uncharacterized OB-fold protein